MVCGVNSHQSDLVGTELAARDGRFKTDLVLVSFAAAAALSGRTFGFAAEALQLLGFFFTVRTNRETIAAT